MRRHLQWIVYRIDYATIIIVTLKGYTSDNNTLARSADTCGCGVSILPLTLAVVDCAGVVKLLVVLLVISERDNASNIVPLTDNVADIKAVRRKYRIQTAKDLLTLLLNAICKSVAAMPSIKSSDSSSHSILP